MTVGDRLTRQGLVYSCAENWAQIERQNLGNYNRGLNDRDGEGFGMSFGVAKPPMQEQPRSACTGLWGLLFWPDRSPAARRGILRGALVKLMLPVVHLGVSGDGIDEIGAHDRGRSAAWREPSRRPAMWRSRLNKQIMPGHGRSPGLLVAQSAVPAAGTKAQRS